MADEPFSDWPTASAVAASAKHVHAMGTITLLYNDLEYAMSFLLDEYLEAGQEASEAIFYRLTNRERVDVLRELIRGKETDMAVQDLASHAVDCFDVCTENRNILMHLIHSWSEWNKKADLFAKKRNSSKTKDVFYFLTAAQLRKIADDMLASKQFTRFLSMRLYRRNLAKNGEVAGLATTLPDTWPQKPPKPDKMNSLPPRPDP
jgi:hypothetical protein